MLNHCLKVSQSQGSGKRLAMHSKKRSFLLSPLIRQRFLISCRVITSPALSTSNRSTRLRYSMATVLLKVSASSRFWISSSSSWQNFFLRGYSNSLPLSGISPSSFRNWQNSSNRRWPLLPHLARKSRTPRLISSSWLALSSGGISSQLESLTSCWGCLTWKLQVKVLMKLVINGWSSCDWLLVATSRQKAQLLMRSSSSPPRTFSRCSCDLARKEKQSFRILRFINKNYKLPLKLIYIQIIQGSEGVGGKEGGFFEGNMQQYCQYLQIL